MKRIVAVLLSCCLVPALFGSEGKYPNSAITPGAILAVTRDDVCSVGYSKAIRNVPVEVKRRVYDTYGIQYVPRTYEVDHLIPLELGGSNSIRNLWPEPYGIEWNAHVKDRLENRPHNLVCEGAINLDTAQRAISHDWIAAYREYLGSARPRRTRRRNRGEQYE